VIKPAKLRPRSETILIGFAVLMLLASAGAQNTSSVLANVPASRLEHLRHGINTSQWFAQVYDQKGYTKEHFLSWITVEDIALIKAMGFDHIRLSVDPEPMFTMNHPNDIPAQYLGYLDAAVKMILDHGLAVIIDIQPEDNFKARLADDNFVPQFLDFWRALAQHYANWDPERVFFEVLNEPEQERYRWIGIQAKAVAAIRQGAPQHTIISAGARWSNNDELTFLEPVRDPNVIYNFHFYSPYLFTHQGATWGVYYWHWVKGLRYPSTRESAEQAAGGVPEAADRLEVIRYGYENWNSERIDGEIAQVAEWGRRNKVPVMCNEFGVYRQYADPRDRGEWIEDVRTSLERHGIGWTMWDYSGSFGVVTKKNGQTTADESALRALGLKAAGAKE
jgi:endoglucanase